MKWIFLLLAIVTEVIATTALKDSEGFTKLLPSIIVIVGYSLTFFFLSITLKQMSVGITYAIWSGLGILFINLIGYFRYNQIMDAPAVLGMLFIGIGILIIRFFSSSV
jgi:small multidrug resistance pump